MSEIWNFFRYCPSCGRRFHIRLVGKKLVGVERNQKNVEEGAPLVPRASLAYGRSSPLVLEQDVPVTVDIKKFQYSYKCKHCGHAWSEMRTKTSEE
jgi:predicted RNA-binding Zn-ribbon protein involved in translation (DUF1610 family)